VIAYDIHRCCGGGKICTVSIRERTRGDPESGLVPGGPDFLVDPRRSATARADTAHGARPRAFPAARPPSRAGAVGGLALQL